MNEYKIGIMGSDTLIQNFLCLFCGLNLETLKKDSTEALLFSYIQLIKQEENLKYHFYYKLDRNPASRILIASKIEFIIILMDSKTNQNILTISDEFHKKNGHLKFIIFEDINTPHDFTGYQQINAREKYYGHISLSREPEKNPEEDKLIYHCLMNHCREAFKQFETYEDASSHHMITPHLDNHEVTNDNGAFFCPQLPAYLIHFFFFKIDK